MTLRSLCLPSLLFVALAAPALAQTSSSMPMQGTAQSGPPKAPLSPPATAETRLEGKSVTIRYSAPSLRGRVMVGEHDPYDKVWRTGANAATTLVTETPLRIGTLDVPAGTYTIYSLPEAPGTPWQLIVNRQTGQWGTEYHQDQDLGRTPMTERKLETPQETMTLSFEHVHGKRAELHIRWGSVDEFVLVEAK